jgi:Sap, sulfolipid-1-addressing protein
MLEQAAGFAFLAALSPGALLVVTAYLGSESPRRTVLFFLVGALVMSVAAGIVVVVALHSSGLNHPHQRQPRYGLRLGLGVIALGASVALSRRKPRAPDPNRKKGLVSRLLNRPAPITAFAAGVIVFIPSAAFIAAAQAIATARASVDVVVGAVALIVIIDVMFAWLPLLLYLAAPDATARRLKALNGWLHAHGHAVVVGLLALVGLLLVTNGIVGLAA